MVNIMQRVFFCLGVRSFPDNIKSKRTQLFYNINSYYDN